LGSSKQDGPYVLGKDEKLWMFARLKGNQKLVAYLKMLVNGDQKKITTVVISGGAVVTANPLHGNKETENTRAPKPGSKEHDSRGTKCEEVAENALKSAAADEIDHDSDDEF
jgi:hypothetical protein